MFPPFNFKFGSPSPTKFQDRFKTLFQPEQEEDPFSRTSMESNEVAPTQPGFIDVYTELMNRKSGPAMEAYRKFVEKPAPSRSDFKVGKLNRLGAILSGAAAGFQNPGSGVDIVQNALDKPYREGMSRYADEGGRLRELAGLEENEYKGKVATVKAIADVKNQEADNKRQDALAQSLMSQRKLTMEETRQRIEANGATFHEDKATGIGYLVKRNGTKVPVGKFDLSSGEKLDIDLKKLNTTSALTLNRQKTMSGIEFGQRKVLQEDSQKHANELEATRNTNRIKLTESRLTQAAKIAAEKVKAPVGSDVQLKRNIPSVQALVDSDPDKYEDFWNYDAGALTDMPDKDSPDYAAYMELYNALYKGIVIPKVTKSGNTIVRNP